MTDKIVYTIESNGVDGRDQTRIEFASYDEQKRDTVHNGSRNKGYLSKNKRIVEVERETKQAFARVNGIDRLLLGLDQRVIK